MKNLKTKMLGLALLLAGLALGGAGMWLLLKPAQFAATARIKDMDVGTEDFTPDEWRDFWKTHLAGLYDGHFIVPILKRIQSDTVLTNVVATLNLNELWGKKYSSGKAFKTAKTVAIIKNRLRLTPVCNTWLIEITFHSEDLHEAAQVASAIAEAYQNYRIKSRAEVVASGLQILQQKYRDDEEKIRVAQTNVDLLRENYQSKKELNTVIKLHDLLGSKIKALELNLQQPQSSSVQITNRAEPPQSPVGPNRVLGAVLLGIGLLPLAGGILLFKPTRR